MIHQQLIEGLARAVGPRTTQDLSATLGLGGSAEAHAAVEVLASLSPEVQPQALGWELRADTPERRILGAIRAYSDSNPARTIFRAAAALGGLSAQEQPTEERLRELLLTSPEFKLLPNAMIKRVS